jgi:hypothetical protein
VTSKGELLVVVALMAPDVRRWSTGAQVVGLAAAAIASSARWGTTSLEALASVQAVLGPAGGIGPAWGAAASWLAGAAILLVGAWDQEPVRLAATGAVVAAVLAGPAPGGEVPVRVAVAVGGAAAAWALASWRGSRPPVDVGLGWLAGAVGLAALGAALAAGIVAAPDLEGRLVAEGAAIAVAVVAAWAAGERALGRLLPRWRPQGGSPTVVQPAPPLP